MTTPPFDPAQYKTSQRQEWDTVAAGWRKWWETIERGAQRLSDRMVDIAAIKPGHRVLDIATGIGEPAVTAAKRVGSDGRVTATDQSQQMLAIAKERAADLGLQNVEFREIDGESLDFSDDSFDAALCRWGLMFMPDVAGALRGIRRCLVPGGWFAAATWAEPPKVPMLSLPMGVLREMVNVPQPPPGAPGPLSLADTGALERNLTDAGFSGIKIERITVTIDAASSDEYVSMLKDVAAPIVALVSKHPPEKKTELWDAIARAASSRATPDGKVTFENESILIAAKA